MKSIEDALLYDFYGNLLTDKMQRALESYLMEDLSLAEIAEAENISRQGVYDTIRRAIKTLHDYETKLGLANKFNQQASSLDQALKLIDDKKYDDAKALLTDLRDEILGE